MKGAQQRNIATLEVKLRAQALSAAAQSEATKKAIALPCATS